MSRGRRQSVDCQGQLGRAVRLSTSQDIRGAAEVELRSVTKALLSWVHGDIGDHFFPDSIECAQFDDRPLVDFPAVLLK